MQNKLKQVGLLGLPFDHNSSFTPGPAKAPEVIRRILTNGSLNSATENGIELKANPQWTQCGDIAISQESAFVEEIQAGCSELLSKGIALLSIGGDHSVSYPILRAYAEHFEDLNILHIDAHSDLYDSFKGNRLSNACPFARIMEEGLCKRLVQVGIRTLNVHQREQAAKFGVEMIQMKDWDPMQLPTFSGPVYISLDIDGLDPAFAPGVSHREPGGLTSREVINMIHHIDNPVVGADIVEFNPLKDIDDMTAQLAAKLVKEVAGQMLLSLAN
ncbi:MAG: arginase [Paraglaciecola sp.]|jgi:arginase